MSLLESIKNKVKLSYGVYSVTDVKHCGNVLFVRYKVDYGFDFSEDPIHEFGFNHVQLFYIRHVLRGEWF